MKITPTHFDNWIPPNISGKPIATTDVGIIRGLGNFYRQFWNVRWGAKTAPLKISTQFTMDFWAKILFLWWNINEWFLNWWFSIGYVKIGIINEPIQIAHSFLDKLLIGLFNFVLLKSIKYYFADLRRFLGSNIGIVLLFKIICLLPPNTDFSFWHPWIFYHISH